MTILYVGGIPYTTTSEDLAAHFRPFGTICSVEVHRDMEMNRRSKGFGHIEFDRQDSASRAVAALDKTDFLGRLLTVNITSRVVRWRDPWRPPKLETYNSVFLASFLVNRPIIEVSNSISLALLKYIRSHPAELQNIDRRRFEELIAELWSGFGYEVVLTPKSRDGGVDVIAVRHAIVNECYLIQCKRPNPGKPIGVRPVRELHGVLQDKRATKGVLVTTAHFSRDAIIFIERNEWQLEGRDFDGLMEWIEHYIQLKA